MKKALRQKLWLAVEAAMKTDTTLAEKAYAARKLTYAIEESVNVVGPEKAARVMRSMVEKAGVMYPTDHEVTLEGLVEAWREMESQKQRLN